MTSTITGVQQISINDKRERDSLIAGEPLAGREIAGDVHTRIQDRSPFFEDMEHAAFLATGDGRDVARCAVMINHRWHRDNNDVAGFVGYFAALRDADVPVAELLAAAEQWLAQCLADRVIGPFNGAATHGVGTLTAAFDESPRAAAGPTGVPRTGAAALSHRLPLSVAGARAAAETMSRPCISASPCAADE